MYNSQVVQKINQWSSKEHREKWGIKNNQKNHKPENKKMEIL